MRTAFFYQRVTFRSKVQDSLREGATRRSRGAGGRYHGWIGEHQHTPSGGVFTHESVNGGEWSVWYSPFKPCKTIMMMVHTTVAPRRRMRRPDKPAYPATGLSQPRRDPRMGRRRPDVTESRHESEPVLQIGSRRRRTYELAGQEPISA
jgi:hypothetical protein